MAYDPWNIAATAPTPEDFSALQKKWWRTASEMSSLPNGAPSESPWWNETGLPSFGSHVSTDPGAWLGISMLRQAFAGGPPVHVADHAYPVANQEQLEDNSKLCQALAIPW